MGKPNHSFEKRRREMDKKKKKEEKRQRKLEKKNAPETDELNPEETLDQDVQDIGPAPDRDTEHEQDQTPYAENEASARRPIE